MLKALFDYAFSFCFLIIDLCFLIPEVNAQIFNPTAEPASATGTPTNEKNTEILRKSLTEEKKREHDEGNLKPYTFFLFTSLF